MEEEYKYPVCTRCFTFNHAPFIVDAMNGFTMQETTFPVVTIIVDDASTDGEQDVIRQYLNEHFRKPYRTEETEYAHIICADHKTNPNCQFVVLLLKYNHYSINKDKFSYISEWLDNAKYHALCEGDDYWIDSQKLQILVSFLEGHPDHSLAVHDFKVYESINQRFRKSHPINFLKDNEEYRTLTIDDYKTGLFFTQTLTSVYRSNALKNSYYNSYEAQFDMTLFYAILTQGRCVLFNRKMGVYRTHPGSMTSSKNNRIFHDKVDYKMLKNCVIEKTEESKDFVYNYLKPLALSEIINKRWNVLFGSFKYLGFRRGISLTFFIPISLILEILGRKVRHLLNFKVKK